LDAKDCHEKGADCYDEDRYCVSDYFAPPREQEGSLLGGGRLVLFACLKTLERGKKVKFFNC